MMKNFNHCGRCGKTIDKENCNFISVKRVKKPTTDGLHAIYTENIAEFHEFCFYNMQGLTLGDVEKRIKKGMKEIVNDALSKVKAELLEGIEKSKL